MGNPFEKGPEQEPEKIRCPECGGSGKKSDNTTCPACKGTGIKN